ncbi:RNA polymerase sigma factor [Paraliomyxa miuraensis]|uniref:RNA polymerase sigma factor n=1 Tax=Paraliomyxa miuraensis TaxID=376150 RepID=UPI0022531306|nr:sigma-70 family RNA polymerase sigma factor [Paraliomyxa miuraensis]MCX4241656.1 sigma-70 family RNA polymerase sigma factor [Paraliomyxa miuraensis]
MLGRPDDYALLAQWAQGNRRAGDRLLRRHVPSLRRFFEVKAPEVADDLTQATLLACMESRERFRGDASFKSFLFGIARRRLLLYLRSQERQERMYGFRAAQGPDTVLTPSRCAALRQEQSAMLEGLATLPVQLQMTLQLYYWESMKVAEIAQVFAVPPSTVTSRLARARELVGARIEAGLGPQRGRAIADDFDRWLRSLA